MSRPTNLSIKARWKEVFNSPRKLFLLISGCVIVAVILAVMPMFFNQIEKRQGPVLHDWLLAALPGYNFSVVIFSLIWLMGIFLLYRAIQNPAIFILYIWSFILITMARVLTITFIPLDPPIGLVQLTDPINEIFYGHKTIVKDLFFSGHTATLALILFCLEKKRDKQIALIALIILMILLLLQHIHYTIDVLAAPLIVYPIFLFTRYLLRTCGFKPENYKG